MASLRTTPASFSKTYREKSKNLVRLARKASTSLPPQTVHDLRVTSRRLQAMRRLLPSNIRMSQDHQRFDAALRALLKGTSSVRDDDTLLLTLAPFETYLTGETLGSLKATREVDAEKAVATVREFIITNPVANISQSGLKGLPKRLRRRVQKRSKSVKRLLDVVLKDESKTLELHTLRKEVKKLRYLLELTVQSAKGLSVLTRWQDMLGTAHDLDVALEFASENPAPDRSRRLTKLLERRRHLSYEKFLEECVKDARILDDMLH